MADRQSLWPYLLAVLSAIMAPSAIKHALEKEPVGGANTASSPAPAPSLTKEATNEDNWQEFLCSYLNPKQASGKYCLPDQVLPKTEYLIAGVPDPEATSIPATFDVMVEAMIGAAAAENWRYDRHWLPWGQDKKGDKPTSSPSSPSVANDEPGLMLFRKQDQLLLVFLVGETPTSGVNKTALYKASEFILKHGGPLRILGPQFSGSVPSYKLALTPLTKGKEPKAAVHFVTGSATAPSNQDDLAPYLYEATVEHDGRTRGLFLKWLETRGINRSEVAMLSEAGTAYGAGLRVNRDEDKNVLQIEFPYQISRLRNAYEKDPELKALWKNPAAENKDGKLTWSLATEREDTDRVRTFQGPQTTLLQERQLEQIAGQIAKRGIRAVGINATDILDTVFLTLQLRRTCPDVRVFTMDSDLLFTYSSGALSFNGMLMVSPYPLWPEVPQPPLHASANRSALGVHNAFIRLMGGTEFRDYWSPIGDDRPAVWIAAIGRGNVWPLAVLSDKAPSQLAKVGTVKEFAPWTPKPDWTYWMLWFSFAALSLYGLGVYAARRIAELGWLGAGFDPAFFFLVEPPDRTTERAIYVQMLCAFSLVAFLPFTVRSGWWLIVAALIVFVYTTVQEHNQKRVLISGLGFVAIAAAAAVFWWGHLTGNSGGPWTSFFFDYRLLHPTGGLSPLPAWTLTWFGCALWALMKINQLRTCEVRSPRLASWPADEPLLAGLREALQGASETSAVSGVRWSTAAAILASLVLLAWTLPTGLWSLERESGYSGWAFGVFGAMILLTVLLLVTLAHLFDMQQSSMNILNAIDDHPLGDAFDGLPKGLAASELWRRGSNRQPYQTCLQGVHRLREMPQAAASLPDAEKLLHQMLTRSATGQRAQSEDVAALHDKLNQVAFDVYPALAAKWKAGAAAKTGVDEEFVALRLGAMLRYLVMQMRSCVEYLSLGQVLMILAIISYPFEPQNGLVNMMAVLVAAAGFTVVYTVTRLDQHPVMQKFASQKDAPSFLETLRKVAAFGLPPVVATLTALFPGSVRNLGTLIDAASKYLGGH